MTFEAELAAAVEAAREAGDEAAAMRERGLRYGHKHGHELVSEADLRAEEILHARLADAFPDTGWLSEEHADKASRLDHERTWVVDPIDGTREFLEGVPEYAVSVGLVVAGRPVLGVVYNPAAGELFSATCDGEPSAPRDGLVAPSFRVLVGRGEHRMDEVPPLPAGARTRGVGSVAYRLALVSVGRGDAVITAYGRSEWDVAAGAALCMAAGVAVTDVLSRPLTFNKPDPYVAGLLAAKPGLHSYLGTWVRRYG